MPLYEVISGEKTGTNGNSPQKRKVVAKDFDDALLKVEPRGGGEIQSYSCYDYDDQEKTARYNVTTTRGKTYTAHVQELWWLKIFKIW